jgi:hypothetical protein
MATILYYLVYYPLVLLVEKLWYILGVIVAPFVHFARTVLYLAALPLLLRRLVEYIYIFFTVAVFIGIIAGLFLHVLSTFITDQILRRLSWPPAASASATKKLSQPTRQSLFDHNDKLEENKILFQWSPSWPREPKRPYLEVRIGDAFSSSGGAGTGAGGSSVASSSKDGKGPDSTSGDFYNYKELLRSTNKDGKSSELISTMIFEELEEENHESDEPSS